MIGWAVTENEYTLRGYAHEVHKYETFFQPPMYHMLFEVPDEYNFQSWSKYSINTDYGREYTPILLIFMTAQIKGCIIKSIDQIPMQ